MEIYFYSHTRGEARYLSNFYPSEFYDDRLFRWIEQYMMYYKALTFGDHSTAEKIMNAKSPAECKKLGRQVKNYDDSVWNSVCDSIVEKGCFLKFSQNEDLRKYLLSTGDAILIEASKYDRKWGIGFDEKEAPYNRDRWGENRLGKCLMRVRDKLREYEN